MTNATIAYAVTTTVRELAVRGCERFIHAVPHAVLSRSASVVDTAAATNETTTLFADQMNVVNHGIKTTQAGQQSLAV